VVGQRVSFASNGDTTDAYLALPEAGRGPGVIVIQEWWGLVGHIEDVADRFAARGYVALAPDYFHRTGPGVEYGYDDAGMAGGMKLLLQLDADEMISDTRAALAKAGVDHEVVVYPGADHGFFCDQRASYQKENAEDAWKRVKALFRDRLSS